MVRIRYGGSPDHPKFGDILSASREAIEQWPRSPTSYFGGRGYWMIVSLTGNSLQPRQAVAMRLDRGGWGNSALGYLAGEYGLLNLGSYVWRTEVEVDDGDED